MTGATFDGTKLYAFGNIYNSTTQYSVHRYLVSGSSNGQYMSQVDFPGLAPQAYDIAWSDGDIWVARDEPDSPVLRYSTTGEVTAYILGTEVPAAAGLTEDDSGYLWISDPENDKIYKVDFTTDIGDAEGSVDPYRTARVSANPFNSAAVIQCSGFNEGAELGVYDIRGRMVHQGTVHSGSYTLEGADIPPGTYLVRISDGGGSTTLRVCRTAD